MKIDIAVAIDGPADIRSVARAGEEAGYDAVWTSETKHDPLIQLAAATNATSTVRLGTAITVAFARTPMTLAVAANDLQTLSEGRLMLGLGSQIKPHIVKRFGMPWSHPAPRMREFILAMRAIWDAWASTTPLKFEGEYYTHTLMTPFFDPGPNPWGPPPVLLAGVGELMTETAGEVADGFLVHGFTTEKYLRESTLPALQRGRERAGGTLDGFEIAGAPLIATGRTEAELAAADQGVRNQISFYGSTPAYRPVLEAHGWGELGDELNVLSKQGRWEDMADLITPEVVDAFAVVAPPEGVAAEILRRYGDVMTRGTLYTPYRIAPEVLQQIAQDVRTLSA